MASVYHTVHVRIAIGTFLYNTSKIIFLFLSLPCRGGQEGSGKQRSGQARLPYLWLLLAHYRLYCRENVVLLPKCLRSEINVVPSDTALPSNCFRKSSNYYSAIPP